MPYVEHHCLLLWYLDWSMVVRNWSGLVFFIKNSCFSRDDGSTMPRDEQHCFLLWYLDWSMDVRNWWGLVFCIKNLFLWELWGPNETV
jgi:hypothetical protein